ncbi:unnamed protein product [Prorocentrum cordatum]|uniref:Mannosyltransferase n=1 Tax=Prorocentrum cordatum TaxID=2364126 RepID=A0ABN9PU53_9DINO|nr:unnamed protein product [Polarella glacialis]
MAFSVSEGCGKRWSYAPVRGVSFLLAFAAGPGLWRWLLRKREGWHFLGFLTASYRATHQAWEANRLTKNMALAIIVAASPVTYCSGQLFTIAVCIMFFYTVYHVRTHPYRLNFLNSVETTSLMVLTTSMALSGLLVSPTWYITESFGQALPCVVFALLLTNCLLPHGGLGVGQVHVDGRSCNLH